MVSCITSTGMLRRIYHRYCTQLLLTCFAKQDPESCACLSRNSKEICFIRSVSSNASEKNTNIVNSPYKAVRIPALNLPELIWSRLGKHPNHTAIECGLTGRKHSYAQLQKLSYKLAVSLLKFGARQGQTVVIIAPNSPEHPILFLGVLEAGLTITPINNEVYCADEICSQLKDSDIACIISTQDHLDTVSTAMKKLTEKKETDIKLIVLDVNQDCNKQLPPTVGRFSDLIADHIDEKSLDSLRSFEVKPGNIAVCPYSSGSTGLPKGVQLSHINFVSSVLQLSAPEVDIQSQSTESFQEVIPCAMPFFHTYGFTIIMVSLLHGSKIIVLPKFEQQLYLQILAKYKCTLLYLVPPLVTFLGNNPTVKKEMFQQVKHILCSAAPLQKTDVEKCLQKIPKQSELFFLQAYGSTEATGISQPRHDCTNAYTVGPPLPNTKVKVVHTTTGEMLGPLQNGEICVIGPQVMQGYYNSSKAIVSALDNDGWLRTGDIGYYDKDFNIFIVDRLRELIKVKGFQVKPTELEDLLRTHPAVLDVGVIGIPNEKYGEVPIAYVVKSPKHPTFITDLKEYVAANVESHKKIHDIVFVDEIPRSYAGKILRKEIKKQYLSKTIKN